MKTQIFLSALFIISVISFVSCKVDMDPYQHSPSISIAAGCLSDSTTLRIKATDNEHTYELDTICMDDVVRIVFRLNGYGYNLTHFSIEKGENPAMINLLNMDSLQTIITGGSDMYTCQLQFKEGISGVSLPLNYIPQRVSDTDSIVITLSSDITTKENTVQRVLRIPVKSSSVPTPTRGF